MGLYQAKTRQGYFESGSGFRTGAPTRPFGGSFCIMALEPVPLNRTGGNAARRDTEGAAAVTRAVAELRATRQAVTPAPAQPMGRDSRGRFVKNPS